jgi:hypothetical protein
VAALEDEVADLKNLVAQLVHDGKSNLAADQPTQ